MRRAPHRLGAPLVGVAIMVSVTLMTPATANANTHATTLRARNSTAPTASVPGGAAATPSADATLTLAAAASGAITLPPAPTGFTDQLVSVYGSEYSTASALGKTGGMTSVAQYQANVDQLTPDQLSSLYYATQQVPQWSQIPALMEAVQSDLPAAQAISPTAARAGTTSTPKSTVRAGRTARTRAKASAAGVSASAVAPLTTFQPQDCSGNSIPDAAVFATQIVADVAYLLFNLIVLAIGPALDIPLVGPILAAAVAIVATVFAVLLFAAQVVHDTLVFLQTLSSDCDKQNVDGFLENIDNTTVQSYSLLSTITAGITTLQTTANSNLQSIQDVQTGLTSFQKSLEQTLNNDVQLLQSTTGNDVQTVQNLVQTVQIGLQQDVQTLQAAGAANATLAVNEVDKSTATLVSALAGNLQQVLNEIDTDAHALGALLTQTNQQVLNLVQSNFTTEQNEYEANLKLGIERAMASGLPPGQYKLPVSMGGFLNSTPVGVQEVVNDDMHALQALKVTMAPSTVSLVNAGNTALAAGKYLTAYGNFQKAYQAMAGA